YKPSPNLISSVPEYEEEVEKYVKKIKYVSSLEAPGLGKLDGCYLGNGVVEIDRSLKGNDGIVLVHEAQHALIDSMRGGYSLIGGKTFGPFFQIEIPAVARECLYQLKIGIYENYDAMRKKCGIGSYERNHYNKKGCVETSIFDYSEEITRQKLETVSSCTNRDYYKNMPEPTQEEIEYSNSIKISVELIRSSEYKVNIYEYYFLSDYHDNWILNETIFEGQRMSSNLCHFMTDQNEIICNYKGADPTLYFNQMLRFGDQYKLFSPIYKFKFTNTGSKDLHCSMIGLFSYDKKPEVYHLPLDCGILKPGESYIWDEKLIEFDKIKVMLIRTDNFEPQEFTDFEWKWKKTEFDGRYNEYIENNVKRTKEELKDIGFIISKKDKSQLFRSFLDVDSMKLTHDIVEIEKENIIGKAKNLYSKVLGQET
ncbi:MAG: hypothetical protein KAQ92_00785, partial [Candidatus Aenigmarchaeota archaeon]|nr:hypothetical protein [Candidatus Aenigmarchaeota archaeon]